jgi:hypothetical protein
MSDRDVSRPQLFHSGQAQQTSQSQQTAAEIGVHPLVIKIAVGAASFSLGDARWPVRHTSFREFLKSNIRIGRGTMSGREVLFEIALIPVALAFGATLIGLAWVIFGWVPSQDQPASPAVSP